MITRQEILDCEPCYGWNNYDEFDEYTANTYLDSVGMAGRDAVTAREIADAKDVSSDDRVWILATVLANRSPEKAREFACDCAEQALSLIPAEKRDPRCIAAIEVARRFARGDATCEALAVQIEQLVKLLEDSASAPHHVQDADDRE